MPARTKGEPLGHFIGRYVKSAHARKKFPSLKQRLAVAYSEGGERKRKRS